MKEENEVWPLKPSSLALGCGSPSGFKLKLHSSNFFWFAVQREIPVRLESHRRSTFFVQQHVPADAGRIGRVIDVFSHPQQHLREPTEASGSPGHDEAMADIRRRTINTEADR